MTDAVQFFCDWLRLFSVLMLALHALEQHFAIRELERRVLDLETLSLGDDEEPPDSDPGDGEEPGPLAESTEATGIVLPLRRTG